MIQRVLVAFVVAIASSIANTADGNDSRTFLQESARELSLAIPDLKASLDGDAQNYLDVAIMVFSEANSRLGKGRGILYTDMRKEAAYFVLEMGLINEAEVMTFADGSLIFEDKKKLYTTNLPDIEKMLHREKLMMMRKCSLFLAVLAHRVLVHSRDQNDVKHAKEKTTNADIPDELRTIFVKIFNSEAREESPWFIE